MKKTILFFLLSIMSTLCYTQDLSQGYIPNDLAPHPMQPVAKPAYLASFSDPSFPATTIRRISDAGNGNVIAPMYSTIQAWNADESLMLVYSNGDHQLLNGIDYSFIRLLDDVNPADIEFQFWHFNNPEILFYFENGTNDFIEYNVITQEKNIIVNLATISGCATDPTLGSDIQMMSWDSDVFGFRCGDSEAYCYKISTNTLTTFDIADIDGTAPMPFPSGELFYHLGNIYNANGEYVRTLNLNNVGEHSCLGKLSNGDDAYFAIAFEEGPNGNCQGTLVAHNATNGNCFPVTSYADYGYPQSGTHISALAHKNGEAGWVAVSMMGFDLDGQDLLDQELFVAKVNENSADVYRVAHHRSDENEINYFGEPHVTISPLGTRLLFGSDWSGAEDGLSVDCYVAELGAYEVPMPVSNNDISFNEIKVFPNPTFGEFQIEGIDAEFDIEIIDVNNRVYQKGFSSTSNSFDISGLPDAIYFVRMIHPIDGRIWVEKILKVK